MQPVSKSTLDDLIRTTRKFWETGDKDYLAAKHNAADELARQAFGSAYRWSCLHDIVSGCLQLRKDTPNESIYKVLEILGLEVVPD